MEKLKKMLNQFIENFKKTDLYFDRKLQVRIVMLAAIITAITKLLPELRESIFAVIIAIIIVGGPIFIMAIYDGIIDDTTDNSINDDIDNID